MQVLQVKPADCHRVWPDVEQYVVSAIEKGIPDSKPLHNEHHIRADVASGRQLMFVFLDDGVINGCATVSMVNYPLACCAAITSIGGKMIVKEECLDSFYSLLKIHGATRVQGHVRPSVARLYRRVGLDIVAQLVEKEI